ncbi:MAG: hypothetical protein PW843_24455 [Azospirillaceae bacterium]|nr:hypothetical protein [Azospirillaceae bacterium]
MSRDAYYEALFTYLSVLKSQGTVQTAERGVVALADVAEADLPALFLVVADQVYRPTQGFPAKRTLEALVFLYAARGDDGVTTAGAKVNALLDAVEGVLQPAPGFTQTLGGLAEWVRIDGTVQVFEGPDQTRAGAAVPIRMLIP